MPPPARPSRPPRSSPASRARPGMSLMMRAGSPPDAGCPVPAPSGGSGAPARGGQLPAGAAQGGLPHQAREAARPRGGQRLWTRPGAAGARRLPAGTGSLVVFWSCRHMVRWRDLVCECAKGADSCGLSCPHILARGAQAGGRRRHGRGVLVEGLSTPPCSSPFSPST